MKIAVTGASGNLGQRVVRIALAQGHDIVAIDRAPTPPSDDDDEALLFPIPYAYPYDA